MTLYEHLNLMSDGEELTVWDKDYDIETYFTSDKRDGNSWNRSMWELSRKLIITKISTRGVTVNLSGVIESNIDILQEADIFIECDIDSIMDDIQNILSGSVSEGWMEQFVAALK